MAKRKMRAMKCPRGCVPVAALMPPFNAGGGGRAPSYMWPGESFSGLGTSYRPREGGSNDFLKVYMSHVRVNGVQPTGDVTFRVVERRVRFESDLPMRARGNHPWGLQSYDDYLTAYELSQLISTGRCVAAGLGNNTAIELLDPADRIALKKWWDEMWERAKGRLDGLHQPQPPHLDAGLGGVRRVHVNRQGYDKHGKYWGVGEKLWQEDDYGFTFRAPDYARAKEVLTARAKREDARRDPNSVWNQTVSNPHAPWDTGEGDHSPYDIAGLGSTEKDRYRNKAYDQRPIDPDEDAKYVDDFMGWQRIAYGGVMSPYRAARMVAWVLKVPPSTVNYNFTSLTQIEWWAEHSSGLADWDDRVHTLMIRVRS